MAFPKGVTPELVTTKESASVCLEERYVYGVYKQMSSYFRHQHYNIWPNVEQFLCALPLGSLVADVGCGNGKYLGVNTGAFTVGADICAELVEIAGCRAGNEVLTCDNLRLPYRDNVFDGVISIGVIHHLTSARRRRQAVRELCRVLRPGGRLMICVWAFEQKHRKFGSQDILIPWCNNDGKYPVDKKARDPIDHCSVDENFLVKKCCDLALVYGGDSSAANTRQEFARVKKDADRTRNNLNGNEDVNRLRENTGRTTRTVSLHSARNRLMSFVPKILLKLLGDTSEYGEDLGSHDVKALKHVDVIETRILPEHSLSFDDKEFAVREFPLSSWPKKVVKQSSLDAALIGNTKFSLYSDMHENNTVHVSQFEKASELFSGLEQGSMRNEISLVSGLRNSAWTKATDTIGLNRPSGVCNNRPSEECQNVTVKSLSNSVCNFKDLGNVAVAQFESTSGIAKLNSGQNHAAHQSLTNLSFKPSELALCDGNRRVKQHISGDHDLNGSLNNGHKTTSTRVQKSLRPPRVRRLSCSQTIESRSGHKISDDSRTALNRDKIPLTKNICRKLSTSSLLDTSSNLANGSCESEILLKNILDKTNDTSSVTTVGVCTKDQDNLNQDSCLRFYHVFAEGELVELIHLHVPHLRIVEARYEHANWCVIAQKH